MIWSTDHTKGTLVAVLLVAGCLGAAAYARSMIEGARSQAVQDTEAKFQKQLVAQRADYEKRIADRNKQTDSELSAMQATVAKLKTPQQQVQWSQEQLAEALKGIKIEVNPQTGNAEAVIPKETLPDLPKVIEQCKECEVKLATNQVNIADREAQMKLAQQQIESLKSQRDAAITASKGGSFWRRLKNNAKWLVIGAAGGAIAIEAVKH